MEPLVLSLIAYEEKPQIHNPLLDCPTISTTEESVPL